MTIFAIKYNAVNFQPIDPRPMMVGGTPFSSLKPAWPIGPRQKGFSTVSLGSYKKESMKNINVLLFKDFTTLDALGPTEVISRLKDHFYIDYYSISGGQAQGSGNVTIYTKPTKEIQKHDVLLVPGGFGTRELVKDINFIEHLKVLAEKSETILCICTGSALLAKTGLLKGVNATSNKMAWDWVIQQDTEVLWKRKARWMVDGKFYTSSGVSAGIDMSLGFLEDNFGKHVAIQIGKTLEYVWDDDRTHDPFA